MAGATQTDTCVARAWSVVECKVRRCVDAFGDAVVGVRTVHIVRMVPISVKTSKNL